MIPLFISTTSIPASFAVLAKSPYRKETSFKVFEPESSFTKEIIWVFAPPISPPPARCIILIWTSL